MRRYNLLKESDIIPNNTYLAIVYYPYPSPNRNAMTEFIYVDDGMYNDLLNGYDFRLQEKLNKWLLDTLKNGE